MMMMMKLNFEVGNDHDDKRNGMINDIDDAVLTCT